VLPQFGTCGSPKANQLLTLANESRTARGPDAFEIAPRHAAIRGQSLLFVPPRGRVAEQNPPRPVPETADHGPMVTQPFVRVDGDNNRAACLGQSLQSGPSESFSVSGANPELRERTDDLSLGASSHRRRQEGRENVTGRYGRVEIPDHNETGQKAAGMFVQLVNSGNRMRCPPFARPLHAEPSGCPSPRYPSLDMRHLNCSFRTRATGDDG
jgi:hypothetical protein